MSVIYEMPVNHIVLPTMHVLITRSMCIVRHHVMYNVF